MARIDAALLGLLALAGPQPRDRVAAWLWPQVPLRNANLTLRQRLFKLRQQLQHPLVDSGQVLRLAADVKVDASMQPPPQDGELLGGLDFGDLDTFDAWLTEQRDALELRRLDGLAGEAARLEARGALAQAIALSEHIISRRPALEHAWRRLMRLHYLRGDRVAAVSVFERFEQQVCKELGLQPAPETLALLDTVERLPVVTAATAATAAMPALLPAALTRPPRLIGRAEQLHHMAQAWSEGRALLLLGQGGIGKSRLMEAFLQGRDGCLMLRTRPGLAAMPYACIGQLLVLAQERFAPELWPAMRLELARLQPVFGPAPESPARQDVLWQAVEALLAACALHGLAVVAVDDLHQADPASLELLYWLMGSERLQGLRWCCAARAHEIEPGSDALKHWLGDSQRVEPVALAPLPALQVAELLDSLALPAALRDHAGLATALLRHAGGHPFFTLETLKGLCLSGAEPEQGLPRPAAADALIARRLDRLTASARDLLRLLALAGSELRLDLAAQVLAQPLPTLAQAWSELDQAQLTQGTDIAHDLVRDCVLARLPQAARQALHLALAGALDPRPGVASIQRAEHWLGGQAWPEAMRALREAALQARLAGRLREYETLLQRAADAATRAGDDAARFDAQCQALAVRMLRLGADAALAPLAQALEQAGSDAQRGRLLSLRCEAHVNLGQPDAALAAGSLALALAAPGTVEQFEAQVLHGRALGISGRVTEAIAMLEAARDNAPAFADPMRLMQAHGALAHGLCSANRYGDALLAQQQALALAEQLGDATEIAHHLSNLAAIASNVGDVAASYRAASAAHQRFQSLGMWDGHCFVNAVILSRHAAHLGRLDEAAQVLAPVLATDPAHLGPTIRALVCVADLGLQLLLGQAKALQSSALALAGLERPALLPLVRASVLLHLLRYGRCAGADTAPLQTELIDLGRQHPALRDNLTLYREWARWDEPAVALTQLQRLAHVCGRAGAHAAARSMDLAGLELMFPGPPAQAARLAQRLARAMPEGTMVGVHPPEAWNLLARALRGGGREAAAQRCLRQGLAWLAATVLPINPSETTVATREMFLQALPAHRALLAAGNERPTVGP